MDFQLSSIQPNTFIAFGILLLFGVLGGAIANKVKWLPTITAFMFLGVIVGPHGLGLISKNMLHEAYFIIDVALGLILYKLGNMLHPKQMLRSRSLLFTSIAEALITFIIVFSVSISLDISLVSSALIGAISVSSSPAVLVHISEELHASGVVTDRAKSLVALNNLIAFLLFSFVLPFAILSSGSEIIYIIASPIYRLLMAIVIGCSVAFISTKIAALLYAEDNHYRFAIMVGAVMLTLGVSNMFGASALLAPLIMGIATRFFETSKNNLSRIRLGEGGDVFFILLFVMAGAKIDLLELVQSAEIVFVLVATRFVSKIAGVFAVAKYTRFSQTQTFATSLLLVPMAGMAIGLVSTTTRFVPEIGSNINAIIFAMVAVFETIGPFVATYAFRIAKETGKIDDE